MMQPVADRPPIWVWTLTCHYCGKVVDGGGHDAHATTIAPGARQLPRPRMCKREGGRSGCGGPTVQPDVAPLLRFRLLERLSAAAVENGLGAVVENHLVLV